MYHAHTFPLFMKTLKPLYEPATYLLTRPTTPEVEPVLNQAATVSGNAFKPLLWLTVTTFVSPSKDRARPTLPATPAVGQPVPTHDPLFADPDASLNTVLAAFSSRCSNTMFPAGGGGAVACVVAVTLVDWAEKFPATSYAETV